MRDCRKPDRKRRAVYCQRGFRLRVRPHSSSGNRIWFSSVLRIRKTVEIVGTRFTFSETWNRNSNDGEEKTRKSIVRKVLSCIEWKNNDSVLLSLIRIVWPENWIRALSYGITSDVVHVLYDVEWSIYTRYTEVPIGKY